MHVLWICTNIISVYTIPINPSNGFDWFMVAQNHKHTPCRKKQTNTSKHSFTENCIVLVCVCVYNISSLERQSYELPLLIISPSPQGISNFRLQHYVLWGWVSEMELVSHIKKKEKENRKQSCERQKWFSSQIYSQTFQSSHWQFHWIFNKMSCWWWNVCCWRGLINLHDGLYHTLLYFSLTTNAKLTNIVL